jgi:hypothetical protein
MEEINIETNYGTRFSELWDDTRFANIDVLRRGYLFDRIIKVNALLFIGINPSFDENKDSTERIFFDNSAGLQTHPYFKKFPDVAKKAGLAWSHFDLLGIRETKQENISNLLTIANGPTFVAEHLQISKEIIIAAKPKIIVVSNALARDFMGYDNNPKEEKRVCMDFDFKFDDDIGTYRITNNGLDGTPVFFSSMLTGQRALDKGSLERLIWHIKHANSIIDEGQR